MCRRYIRLIKNRTWIAMNHISDLLSSISVLLVFLTILVTYVSTELRAILDELIPDTTEAKKREKFFRRLRFVLFVKSLPITLVFILVTYILLPHTIDVISTSSFSWWNFDSLKTIFVIIEFGLIGFTIYSLTQTIRLIRKLTK